MRGEAGPGDGCIGALDTRPPPAGRASPILGLAGLLVALVAAVLTSLAVGTKPIPVGKVVEAFTAFDPSNSDHLIVRELRLGRTLVGIEVGAALAIAGALMQGLTRNPLADPGLLGVNAGAAFAVVLAIRLAGTGSVLALVWFAFAGAGLAAILVFALGSFGPAGNRPIRLVLAGTAITALLASVTRAVTLTDQATLDQFRFWAVGSLAGRDQAVALELLPFVLAGIGLAVGASRSLNALALGEDAARALGTRAGRTRLIAIASITLLCGSAVAACGPLTFVGLVVPHAMRMLSGPDQRWLVPACGLGGSTVVLACDTVGRVVTRPAELEVGITMAAVGGLVFAVLARRAGPAHR